jgi:hypothetical protein
MSSSFFPRAPKLEIASNLDATRHEMAVQLLMEIQYLRGSFTFAGSLQTEQRGGSRPYPRAVVYMWISVFYSRDGDIPTRRLCPPAGRPR